MNDWQIGMQIIKAPAPVVLGAFKAPKVTRPKPKPPSDSDAAIELETMVKLSNDGLKMVEIARQIGRSKSYVHAHLAASGRYTGGRVWSRRGMIANMLREGRYSVEQIAERFDISRTYTTQVIRKLGGVKSVKVGVVPYYWIGS